MLEVARCVVFNL